MEYNIPLVACQFYMYSKFAPWNYNLMFSLVGKKGRSTAGKQGAKSMLSLECSASLLRALFR